MGIGVPQATEELGRPINTCSAVMDLKNLKSPSFPLFKVIADMDSRHYPEIANKVYVLNAPWFLSGMWKIAQRFIDPVTREKV